MQQVAAGVTYDWSEYACLQSSGYALVCRHAEYLNGDYPKKGFERNEPRTQPPRCKPSLAAAEQLRTRAQAFRIFSSGGVLCGLAAPCSIITHAETAPLKYGAKKALPPAPDESKPAGFLPLACMPLS